MEGRFQWSHNNIHSRKRQTRCGIALPERNNSCASGMPARRAITVVYYCRDWIDDPSFPEGIQIWLLLLFPNLPSPFRQILLEWKNYQVTYVKLSQIALLYNYIAVLFRWRIWKNEFSYPHILILEGIKPSLNWMLSAFKAYKNECIEFKDLTFFSFC